MPSEPAIKAEVSLSGGVASVQISGPGEREHAEFIPLHPRYPEGSPEEFLALDSLRSALVTVEKEGFPSLFDLRQTQESAERAKELGLHQEPTLPVPVGFVGGRRGGGGRAAAEVIQAAMRGDWGSVRSEVESAYRRQPPEPTASLREETGLQYIDTGVRPERPEPAPIVAGGNLVNGRHIITPGGTYRVVRLRSSFLVDPTRTPEGPSDEWIRTELARRIANELAGHISVSRVVQADPLYFSEVREYRADIVLLERRD